MRKDVKQLLQFLAATEAISPKDELSKLIDEDAEEELTMEMLEQVVAAASPDQEKWKKFLEKSKE